MVVEQRQRQQHRKINETETGERAEQRANREREKGERIFARWNDGNDEERLLCGLLCCVLMVGGTEQIFIEIRIISGCSVIEIVLNGLPSVMGRNVGLLRFAESAVFLN